MNRQASDPLALIALALILATAWLWLAILA